MFIAQWVKYLGKIVRMIYYQIIYKITCMYNLSESMLLSQKVTVFFSYGNFSDFRASFAFRTRASNF